MKSYFTPKKPCYFSWPVQCMDNNVIMINHRRRAANQKVHRGPFDFYIYIYILGGNETLKAGMDTVGGRGGALPPNALFFSIVLQFFM